MSPASKRARNRSTGAPAALKLAVGALAVVVMALVVANNALRSVHPTPRTGLTSAHVQSAHEYADDPEVAAIYAAAAEIPHVLDGLYCYCDCSRHHGHRSLLTCFQSEHGAACDVCLREAKLAAKMTAEGKTLKQIQDAIDQRYAG